MFQLPLGIADSQPCRESPIPFQVAPIPQKTLPGPAESAYRIQKEFSITFRQPAEGRVLPLQDQLRHAARGVADPRLEALK